MQTRTEKDSMGAMEVPDEALYGATTQRAVLNFPISGYRFGRPLIRALGLVKWAAAQANRDLEKLDEERARLIVQAAEEVIEVMQKIRQDDSYSEFRQIHEAVQRLDDLERQLISPKRVTRW